MGLKQKIAVASDHAGFEAKESIRKLLEKEGFSVRDFGPADAASVDYTGYAHLVADAVSAGEASFGILICGTGIGMSIAANKVPGIRAAVCTNEFMAEATRAHNDANILCLGARVNSAEEIQKIARKFLSVKFEGGRHSERISKYRL